MLHYNLFKKKVKRDISYKLFGYLLILLFLLIVCLLVKQKGMFIFFITYLIIIIYPLYKIIKFYIKLNKKISKNDEKLRNLELSNILFEGMDYTLTQNYVVDNTSFTFIKYEDILLIETTKKLGLGASFTTPLEILYIYTKDGNYSLITKDFSLLNNNNIYYGNLSDFIKYKNPEVLIGNNENNRKLIKEKFNIDVGRNWRKYFKIILDVR